MPTSGTVGTTRINTAKLLEKAIRRCGLSPTSLVPETITEAKESMFMFLLSMSGRGLNLWCIEKNLMGLAVGQATYTLPAGTIDVLNLLLATPSEAADATIASGATTYSAQFADAVAVTRVGVKFSVLPTTQFSFQSSDDGIAWTTHFTVLAADFPAVGAWAWYDVDPAPEKLHYRLSAPVALGTVTEFFLAPTVREINMSQFNRDDFANQPNKTSQSATATNFYLNKLVDPTITLWPVPNDDTRHLVLFRHRQIQDVGTLSEELEVPSRWLEPVCWHLALRLSYELPNVDPARRAEIASFANSMTIESENGETDHAPIYFAPNISCYTR